ncbi:ArsR/SmtB family transcription factor [Pseudozobellia thermophila]|uniref:ArsR family transcriptional regulator n=1 Tax=Pseudozobellia thermophila TaxID=192903 RepID=A0A1M6NDE8_9FLAO|nr:metalloregulator ArsR/SmtB family transcription factor [Pseudozobellia thermophila]SHJ93778.1 ArsR family transcriptional regulator [Pseudozobellia thermophila]
MYNIEKEMDDYIKVFKALSDMTRLKIMWLLLNIDEKVCVSEIVDVLEVYQYNVSRHLRILKDAKLINEVKEGKWVFYHLSPLEGEFGQFVHKAICSIPETEMTKEMTRCKVKLALRTKDDDIPYPGT